MTEYADKQAEMMGEGYTSWTATAYAKGSVPLSKFRKSRKPKFPTPQSIAAACFAPAP